MTLLMDAGLVDGEDADTIESDYIQASCLVTSSTDNVSFATGEGISRRFRLDIHNRQAFIEEMRNVRVQVLGC